MKHIAGGFFLGVLATVIVLTGLSWHRDDVAETIARAKFDQQMSDSSKELGKLADSIINDPAWCGNIPCKVLEMTATPIRTHMDQSQDRVSPTSPCHDPNGCQLPATLGTDQPLLLPWCFSASNALPCRFEKRPGDIPAPGYEHMANPDVPMGVLPVPAETRAPRPLLIIRASNSARMDAISFPTLQALCPHQPAPAPRTWLRPGYVASSFVIRRRASARTGPPSLRARSAGRAMTPGRGTISSMAALYVSNPIVPANETLPRVLRGHDGDRLDEA